MNATAGRDALVRSLFQLVAAVTRRSVRRGSAGGHWGPGETTSDSSLAPPWVCLDKRELLLAASSELLSTISALRPREAPGRSHSSGRRRLSGRALWRRGHHPLAGPADCSPTAAVAVAVRAGGPGCPQVAVSQPLACGAYAAPIASCNSAVLGVESERTS